MNRDDLGERLAAVERRLTEGADCGPLADAGALEARIESLEERAEAIEERTADLESGVHALRGYVGEARTADGAVERRANAAIARVERLEDRIEETLGTAGENGDRTDDPDGRAPPGERSGRTERTDRRPGESEGRARGAKPDGRDDDPDLAAVAARAARDRTAEKEASGSNGTVGWIRDVLP